MLDIPPLINVYVTFDRLSLVYELINVVENIMPIVCARGAKSTMYANLYRNLEHCVLLRAVCCTQL